VTEKLFHPHYTIKDKKITPGALIQQCQHHTQTSKLPNPKPSLAPPPPPKKKKKKTKKIK